MPVRTVTVELEGDYAGWEATIRTNPPYWQLQELGSGDRDKFMHALGAIVTTWNFVDEDGAALPAPGDGGIQLCPSDLLALLVQGATSAINKAAEVPKD